ncbi:class I SAM-dependent methyltransferase [Maribacter sp. CXY002]|uniref:class I SAM-dependent methyltransferase n=1 Tax=Maribacter luteocoastalis TaxID=3407671 RepID=UPI003B673029
MAQIETFEAHVRQYENWYEEHPGMYQSEVLAIKEQLQELPENIRVIEVGLGTGRFAEALGIKEGVEPSPEMAKKAKKRGIEIIEGTAERLPYSALQFDFVLFVTICFLQNIKLALNEAHRVLKPNGAIIIGFLDKDQNIAKEYMARRHKSNFYGKATFYSVSYIERLLKEAGFKDLKFNQTLFNGEKEIKEIQLPKPSFGEGSFVTVKAIKR